MIKKIAEKTRRKAHKDSKSLKIIPDLMKRKMQVKSERDGIQMPETINL